MRFHVWIGRQTSYIRSVQQVSRRVTKRACWRGNPVGHVSGGFLYEPVVCSSLALRVKTLELHLATRQDQLQAVIEVVRQQTSL